MKAFTLVIGSALLLLFVPLAAAQEKDLKELTTKDIVGMYIVTAGEKNGEKLPADRVAGQRVRFTEEKIIATDKDDKETYTCTYKLDGKKNPPEITMVSTVQGAEGQVAKGLVQWEGSQLRLIYSFPTNLDPPTKFRTEEGQLMLILKKVKQ